MKAQSRLWLRSVLRYTLGSVHDPATARDFARSWARFPYRYAAEQDLKATPEITLGSLVAKLSLTEADRSTLMVELSRMEYNTRLDEQIAIGLVVRLHGCKRIFEIGTFDGDMTRYIAEQAGCDAQVWTLDLEPAEFDRRMAAADAHWFHGADIGRKYRDTPEAERIHQLYGDSARFDFSPYIGKMDLVFVDATHQYGPVLNDTKTALRLVRPGGLILWHDYSPQWPGVVRAVREGTEGKPLRRLDRTTVAMLPT